MNERAIERLLDSPVARQAAADEQRERLARREQLIAEIAEHRASIEPRLAALRAGHETLVIQVAAARRQLEEHEAELAQAEADAFSLSVSLDHEIAVRERALRATAHPAIENFLTDARARANAARSKVVSGGFTTRRETLTGRILQVAGPSNAASVERVRAALLAAIREVEALQLSATPDAEIEARVAALRADLHVSERPEVIAGQPASWLDETKIEFSDGEIDPVLIEVGPVLTPSEQREARWRLEEEANR